ncbi:hypothetical protein LTR66_008591 [Elasticomyces elasticus]|nr:hypothetical protein LTR66_008591 [Elasticomyces elasticus]
MTVQGMQQNSQLQSGPHGTSMQGRETPGFLIDEEMLEEEEMGLVARTVVEVWVLRILAVFEVFRLSDL